MQLWCAICCAMPALMYHDEIMISPRPALKFPSGTPTLIALYLMPDLLRQRTCRILHHARQALCQNRQTQRVSVCQVFVARPDAGGRWQGCAL